MKRKSLILTVAGMAALLVVIVSVVMVSKGMKQTDSETKPATDYAEIHLEAESEDSGQVHEIEPVPESDSDGKQGEETVPSVSLENETAESDNAATQTESSSKSAESPSPTMPSTPEQNPGSKQEETPPVTPTEPVSPPKEQATVPTDPTPEPTETEPTETEPTETEPVPTVPEEPTLPQISATMEKYTDQGLGYWLYTPENPSVNMPLIVYLHGGSGKGDDLDQLLEIDGLPKWLYDGSMGEPSAYILIPQLSSSQKGWSDAGSSVIALIDEIAADYEIDTNNISLTGHSMGGTGTFALAKAYPDTFARIAPCSGSIRITNDDLAAFQNIDVWAFVGSEDTIVDPKSSIYFVDRLSPIGRAKLTQFEEATHFDVPALVYLNSEINIVNWLIGG